MISVVVPVYNRPEQLRMAVASALSQKGLRSDVTEVIVVDDASPQALSIDGIGAGRVRLIRLKTNRGVAAARNTGIAHASHDLIALLDSDDLWLPGKLAGQVALLRQLIEVNDTATTAVAGGFYYLDRKRGRIEARVPRGAHGLQEFASGCWYCPGSTLLIHRAAFERFGLFDERLRRLEDLDWFMRFARGGGRLHVCGTVDTLVAPSSLGSRSTVRPSSRLIAQKYCPGSATPLPAEAWRSLKSYLALERAAASLADGAWLDCARNAVASLASRPRLRIQLRDFWERSDQVPVEIARLFETMAAAKAADVGG